MSGFRYVSKIRNLKRNSLKRSGKESIVKTRKNDHLSEGLHITFDVGVGLRGVMANLLDCDLAESGFERQSRYYVHFSTHTRFFMQ